MKNAKERSNLSLLIVSNPVEYTYLGPEREKPALLSLPYFATSLLALSTQANLEPYVPPLVR